MAKRQCGPIPDGCFFVAPGVLACEFIEDDEKEFHEVHEPVEGPVVVSALAQPVKEDLRNAACEGLDRSSRRRLRRLEEKGANADMRTALVSRLSHSYLREVVATGSLAEVTKLLEATGSHATMTREGGSLARLAAARSTGAEEMCFLLAARRVDVAAVDTEHCQTPLFWAVRADEGASCADFLISRRCDPNQTDFKGQSPLFHAALAPRAASVLLSHGADANLADASGLTSLHLAAQWSGPVPVLRALLGARADVHRTSAEGHTPLFYARCGEAVEALLEARARVADTDPCSRTALFFAAKVGTDSALRALLAARANTSMRDSTGRTCFDYACSDEIRRMLTTL